MSTVFVVQEVPGRNVLSAEAYGRLEVCLQNQQIILSAEMAINALKEKLSNFTKDDYLLAIGDPVAIGLATAIAAKASGGKVKFLKWDRHLTRYYVVQTQL